MTLTEFLGEFYVPDAGDEGATKSRRNKIEDEASLARIREYDGRDITGVELVMKNGLRAKCIAFRGWNDIDVMFEDGVIVEHRNKRCFLCCGIAHPTYERDRRVGVRVRQHSGEYAVCIDYRSSSDCDIEFEDGTVRYNVSFAHFRNGYIKKIVDTCVVGLVVDMSCGMKAECISDVNSRDLIIRFEDGTIVEHVTRYKFVRGEVKNPNIRRFRYPQYSDKLSVLGERRQMNCGYYCTVIEYRGYRDIDVRFDDGAMSRNRRVTEFLNGQILHPSLGYLWLQHDSIAQRVLWYYISRVYVNVGYNARPESLRCAETRGLGYELDIWLPNIGIGIEFDGAVQTHFDYSRTARKHTAIENAHNIVKVYTVVENDKRIVIHRSPKIQHIFLTYTKPSERLYEVYEVAKYILSDLGNNVDDLRWEPDVVADLYVDDWFHIVSRRLNV